MTRQAATTLPIQLDLQARGDLQEQIYRELRRAIAARILRPDTRIASSRSLAADLGVSRTTTQAALDKLTAEGYLVSRRGSGTFVAAELPDDGPAPATVAYCPVRGRSPQLSRRGAKLAGGRAAARRIPGPARAFRLGVPALEQFPAALWAKLANQQIAAMSARDLDYGRVGGVAELRAAIADHVRTTRGARCEPEQIYIIGGAQRGLDLLCRLLLDSGELAAVEDPGYPGAWAALASADARVAPIPVDDQGLRVDALIAEPAARVAYVTPSHQFPSGVPMSLARRHALLGWAARTGGWIIEDDYDCEFRFGAKPIPCLQGIDAEGQVIYVGTFSKSVYPSLQLGFLIVPGALQDRLFAMSRALADPQPSFLDQAILAEFIAGGHFARHLRRMHAIYTERLDALHAAAARYGDGALALRPTRTGLHAVADLRAADAEQVVAACMARGVEVMSLADYRFGGGRVANALVLGFGAVPPAEISRGMQVLADAIEATARSDRRAG